MYPEPDSFKPERFINPDGSLREDPVLTSLFGFGKRLCPGRHLADATLFIVVASVLSVFDIKKGKDTDGGPDAYPFTGGGLRCGHCISFVARDRKLIVDLSFSAFRALLLTPSSQGIEGQKNLLLPVPRHNELNRPSPYLVLRCTTPCDLLCSSYVSSYVSFFFDAVLHVNTVPYEIVRRGVVGVVQPYCTLGCICTLDFERLKKQDCHDADTKFTALRQGEARAKPQGYKYSTVSL